MNNKSDLKELQEKIAKFVEERDWLKFHSPKNLSMAIAAEAAELMELFLWCETEESVSRLEKLRENVEEEIADVIITSLMLCDQYNIDVKKVIVNKLKKNAEKYPADKVKGNWDTKSFKK